ncbi:hypothetical protein [Amphritea pacifica]|uniref:Uncharacterized protein n=1 Tax=Amphritea pacifica TaxID=2811233 RepID=A0ABS2WEQ2_9GAMM|nr:hypothetical protein [Amphritea pacifica]MBN0989887.1 hypothetical protein [Amphritea pacifica]
MEKFVADRGFYHLMLITSFCPFVLAVKSFLEYRVEKAFLYLILLSLSLIAIQLRVGLICFANKFEKLQFIILLIFMVFFLTLAFLNLNYFLVVLLGVVFFFYTKKISDRASKKNK